MVIVTGGGTVLLENCSGELMVLVSAVAEPVRPAAGDQSSSYVILIIVSVIVRAGF